METYLTEYDREYYSKQRAMIRIYKKTWREKHPEQSKARSRYDTSKRTKRIQKEFFKMYGNKCACGETTPDFLTMDHVQNDGSKRREKKGNNNLKEYRNAVKEYRPDIYQILCFNCNLGKNRNGGVCPHQKT